MMCLLVHQLLQLLNPLVLSDLEDLVSQLLQLDLGDLLCLEGLQILGVLVDQLLIEALAVRLHLEVPVARLHLEVPVDP